MMIGAGIFVMGVLLWVTTPNHPGSPTEPAMHPVIHIVGAAFGILAGLYLIVSEIVGSDDCVADHPDYSIWSCRCESCEQERYLDRARRTEDGASW